MINQYATVYTYYIPAFYLSAHKVGNCIFFKTYTVHLFFFLIRKNPETLSNEITQLNLICV